MTTTKANAILLASGGLDSTTLAFWLREKGIPFSIVFVDYGQHCAETEKQRLDEVLPPDTFGPAKIINVADIYAGCTSRLIAEPDLWEDHVTAEDMYLPYRNMLLLAIASAYAQANGLSEVYTAFINSNHAKEIDCSAEFFDRLGGMLTDYGSVSIKMPFRDMSKREVAEIGLRLNAPIARTFSCQASSSAPCGACPNCVDRLEAINSLE